MKTAIYCRISTRDQKEGTSLDSQLDACKKLAQEKGYEVENEYTIQEVYSGLTLDRPDLAKLRGWLDNKEVDAVIIYSSDRFSRDGYDFLTLIRDCQRANAELLCVTESIEGGQVGELLSYVRGWASKLEAEKIKERTSRGRRARIASGKLAGGKANYCFGYDYIPGRENGQGIRQVNPKQASVVRDIFNWFTSEHLPLDKVIYRLRDLGIASPTGNPMWPRATVYNMLTNSAYCGAQVKTTPPIIDQTTFDKAQARLKRNRELALRNVKRNYLLRGYVYCQHCGRRYQGALKRYQTKEGIKEYEYYRCSSSFKINTNPCSNHSWKAERLEAIIWQEVEKALQNPDVIMAGIEALRQGANRADSHLEALTTIDDRLKDLDKQQQRLLELALKEFPEAMVEAENAKINLESKGLKQRRAEVIARMGQAKQAEIGLEGIEQALITARGNLSNLSFESKRLALEALNIRVILGKDSISIEGNIPVGYGAIVSTPSN
ncbi:MAG: recombinase family protein [Chloroflexi bacterium]|nr:recombinase family protein [Chloroflexota bacterium]